MRKKAYLTYMEKDGIASDDFLFYADQRVIEGGKGSSDSPVKHFHWHDYFELEIVIEGDGKHYFNDTSYDLQRGSAYLITPKDYHSVAFSGTVFHLQFNSFTMSSDVTKLLTNSDSPVIIQLNESELNYIHALCSKLVDEYNNDRPDKKLMIRCTLEQLCILLVRKVVPCENSQSVNLKDELISQVVNYLNYNFRSKVSLRDVSKQFLLNPNYLGEKFTKTLGTTFTAYVNNLRLNYAMKLLKNSAMSIKQISEDSGFVSVSYFIKLFSEKYGESPQRLRNKY